MKNLSHILALLLVSLTAFPVLANMEYSGNINYGFNDNVANVVSDRDIIEDQFISASFNVGKLWVPRVGKSFLWSGHLGSERFNDARGLNRYSIGSSVAYIQRLGLGAYAPRFSITLRADKRDFKSDNRDGWLYLSSFSLEKRFLPELIATATLSREIRTADKNRSTPYTTRYSGDAFNQENNEFSTNLDYTLESSSVVSLRYRYRDGELDASTNPGSAFFGFSKAIGQDHGICTTCGGYVVYLINGSVQSLSVDWNWALGKDMSVSANAERRTADVDGNVSYTGNIFKVQLNRRF